ncbi:hypothetical protein [Streptomyces sp. x-80]|uniref:hypothetical protein n=1 Tax=Streptomyces sp. x-80 TaxID=2789282 RepID=UPI00397F546C
MPQQYDHRDQYRHLKGHPEGPRGGKRTGHKQDQRLTQQMMRNARHTPGHGLTYGQQLLLILWAQGNGIGDPAQLMVPDARPPRRPERPVFSAREGQSPPAGPTEPATNLTVVPGVVMPGTDSQFPPSPGPSGQGPAAWLTDAAGAVWNWTPDWDPLTVPGADAAPVRSRQRRATADGHGPAPLASLTDAQAEDWTGGTDRVFTGLARGADSLERRETARQEYLDTVTREVLEEVSGSAAAKSVDLDGLWTAVARPARRPDTLLMNGGRFDIRWTVTTGELALGEPQRRNPQVTGTSGAVELIPPAGLPQPIAQALQGKEVRAGIATRAAADAERLLGSDDFKKSFTEFSQDRLRGAMARIFAESQHLARLLAAAWLAGDHQESLVEFRDKVVPGVVAVGHAGHRLLVSVETGEHYLWKTDDASSAYENFIRKHLSRFENDAARPADFKPLKPARTLQAPWTYTQPQGAVPRLTFRQSHATHHELWQAAKTRTLSNLDGLVYTSAEHERDHDAMFKRDLMIALSLVTLPVTIGAAGGIGAAVSLGSGAGFGFASAHYDEAIAHNADRGAVYRQAMEDAELGRMLAAGGAVLDLAFAGRALKGVRIPRHSASAAAHTVRNTMRAARSKVALLNLPPRARAARIAAAGTNSAAFTRTMTKNGAVCWDAVIKLQEMAGIITKQERLALGATRAQNFRGFLGGAGKEIKNAESLARLGPGHRVGFVVREGGQRKMIHAMLSMGNGQMAGINNAGLKNSLSPGFTKVNMLGDDILNFADNRIRLSDGRRVKVYADTSAPEFRIETGRSRISSTALNAEETALRNHALTEALDYPSGFAGKTLGKLIENPAGKCEALMNPVASYMRNNGYTNIKFRGMGIWDNVDQRTYANHYVVVGKRDGRRWAFDLSAGQFGNKGMRGLDGPIVDLEKNWAKMYADSTTRKLIKYQDFTTASGATGEFGSVTGLDPLNYMPDSKLLSSPDWYQTAKETART